MINKITNEIWKPIKDFPMYEVSNQGQVRSYQAGYSHLLKPRIKHDYVYVHLYHEGKRHEVGVHVLVSEAFFGPRPDFYVCNHKDGIKGNNDISNLEWITKSDDLKHAYKIGLRYPSFNFNRSGEHTSRAKLKNGEVWLIKRLLWFETFQKDIAKMFKVGRTTIAAINQGYSWQHINFVPTDKDRELYRRRNAKL